MKYIFAISGGVDSMVLLDMFVRRLDDVWKQHAPGEIIVAHFDHGIRQQSHLDAELVANAAAKYGLTFRMCREELGFNASEALARERRYLFLRSIAAEYNGIIVTAHHSDDILETIAINIARGTGWRGLAVLDSPELWRPLLGYDKSQLRTYAAQHAIQWNEDSTNESSKYLRNRIRAKAVSVAPPDKALIHLYWQRQVNLKRLIDQESNDIIGNAPYERHLFIQIDDVVGVELLRTVFIRETGVSPTIPQRERALQAIKVARAGRSFEVTRGVALTFTSTTFIVATTV